ncbi:MAG: endonuclease [Geobacteraceae bacterium]|nr:endonuclease [Geobacteraceae bacterium]
MLITESAISGKETKSAMEKRLLAIFDMLLHQYGPLSWWPADTPFEVCVGAILTQNTNWGNVEKAIEKLKEENLLSPKALQEVPIGRLAEFIRPAGYFNVKSGRLKDFIDWLFREYDGSLERLFSEEWGQLRGKLLNVRGIGPETADSILLYAGQKPSFVVDAYTKRFLSRLGLLREYSPYEEVRALFMENLPADVQLFNEYHALIVQHCKEFCRKKPLCGQCPLHRICEFSLYGNKP